MPGNKLNHGIPDLSLILRIAFIFSSCVPRCAAGWRFYTFIGSGGGALHVLVADHGGGRAAAGGGGQGGCQQGVIMG